MTSGVGHSAVGYVEAIFRYPVKSMGGERLEVANLGWHGLDGFRPNVVVRLLQSEPFQEDEWVGGVLWFGEGDDAPAIAVTMRDERCSMVNFDPDSASPGPEILKAIVRANQNHAGIYGTVTRIGRLAVGQKVILRRTDR